MALAIKFYERPLINEFQSDLQGRPVHEMRDFVRIEIPGMVANVVDTLAGEHHKRDYPQEWAAYLVNKERGESHRHQGTLLSAWELLNAVQVLEMNHLKFYTVEHVADASDAQIMGIGMLAGMSPLSLRDKAKAYLAQAASRAEEHTAAQERDALKAELAELRALIEAQAPKVGRPRKETTEA